MLSGQIKKWIRHAALAAVIAVPLAAAAQDAVVSRGGNLRAGPGQTYPLVAQLPPGTPATVMGCVGGYGWCDIVVPGGVRGWLYSGRLDYVYQGAPVPMVNIGAVIGVPIITFTVDAYWGSYYRDRPWYAEPRWWGGRRPPPMAGWHAPAAHSPAWHPRTPPPTWRAPAARPNMGHPNAGRPNMGRPEARPPVARPQQHAPAARPQQPAPAARPQQPKPPIQVRREQGHSNDHRR